MSQEATEAFPKQTKVNQWRKSKSQTSRKEDIQHMKKEKGIPRWQLHNTPREQSEKTLEFWEILGKQAKGNNRFFDQFDFLEPDVNR